MIFMLEKLQQEREAKEQLKLAEELREKQKLASLAEKVFN